jgi:hypothetical protein
METFTLDATCAAGDWLIHVGKSGTPEDCKPPEYIGPKNCPPNIPHGTMHWVTTDRWSGAGESATCHYEGVTSRRKCAAGTALIPGGDGGRHLH